MITIIIIMIITMSFYKYKIIIINTYHVFSLLFDSIFLSIFFSLFSSSQTETLSHTHI